MDKSICRFHTWSPTVTATPSNSGTPMAAADDGHAAQAVHDQHREDHAGQNASETLNIFRRRPLGGEHCARQKAGEHRAEHAHGDGDDLLRKRHVPLTSVCFSIGFLSAVSAARTQIIVGIKKLSVPKTHRHKTLAASPTHSLIWRFSFSH